MAFKRVLIANRGEIALRILRALRDMGIEAAIIHGREDRLSLPVRLADIAVPIIRENPIDSYLDIEAVVQAAKDVEADAVHPGYGFLADNANFVQRLEEEGITFIGPSSKVISKVVRAGGFVGKNSRHTSSNALKSLRSVKKTCAFTTFDREESDDSKVV